jgi:hypothetical protein
MIEIRKNNVVLIFTYCIFTIIINVYIINGITNFTDVKTKLSCIIILLFTIQTILYLSISKEINFSMIFIWCCYLFWLSQNILLFLNFDFGNKITYVAYFNYGYNAYVQAIKYSTIAVSIVFVGVLFGTQVNVVNHVVNQFEKVIPTKQYVYPLLIISLILDLIQTAIRITINLTSGYEEAHGAGNFINIFQTFTQFFPVAVYLALVIYKEDKKKAKKIYYLFIIYELIKMFGGARAYSVLGIIVITVLYYHVVEKLNIKKFLLISFGGFVLLNVLIVIRNGRYFGTYSWEFNGVYFLATETMKEFGGTINVISKGFRDFRETANGMVTISSILSIIPGWTYIFGDDLINKYYTYFAFDFEPLGSAFPIEYYFDFGYAGGLIACFFQGIIVGMLDKRIFQNIRTGRYAQNSFLIFLIIELIYTVRSYPFRIPRYIFYFILVYKFYDIIFMNHKRRKYIEIV